MYSRIPKADSQCGRLLGELMSAHSCVNPLQCSKERCGRVPLPRILNLRISQYSARVHDLRHRFGFLIDNKTEADDADHTWFRLAGRRLPPPDVLEDREIQANMRAELDAAKTPAGGSTREQLAEWGVPWTPPKGWKKELQSTGKQLPSKLPAVAVDTPSFPEFGVLAPERYPD